MATNLMIVAHPDDESLFGCVQLLKYDYKVVCITNGNNYVRRREFETVMDITNSEFEIWSYPDILHIPFNTNKLSKDLQRLVHCQWDKIVTHNSYGEYGHPHHIQVNSIMSRLVGRDLWVFNLTKPKLPYDVWREKLKLIRVYKSQKHICDGHIPNVRSERIVKENIFF